MDLDMTFCAVQDLKQLTFERNTRTRMGPAPGI